MNQPRHITDIFLLKIPRPRLRAVALCPLRSSKYSLFTSQSLGGHQRKCSLLFGFAARPISSEKERTFFFGVLPSSIRAVRGASIRTRQGETNCLGEWIRPASADFPPAGGVWGGMRAGFRFWILAGFRFFSFEQLFDWPNPFYQSNNCPTCLIHFFVFQPQSQALFHHLIC